MTALVEGAVLYFDADFHGAIDTREIRSARDSKGRTFYKVGPNHLPHVVSNPPPGVHVTQIVKGADFRSRNLKIHAREGLARVTFNINSAAKVKGKYYWRLRVNLRGLWFDVGSAPNLIQAFRRLDVKSRDLTGERTVYELTGKSPVVRKDPTTKFGREKPKPHIPPIRLVNVKSP